MNAWRRRLVEQNRALALWILAGALMLRILVPTGWMPVIGADGMTRITLCSGEGRVVAWVDRSGEVHKQGTPKSDPRHDQPCAFSGLALALADAPPPIIATRHPAPIDRPAIFPASVSIGRGLPAPPPPATGPPATV